MTPKPSTPVRINFVAMLKSLGLPIRLIDRADGEKISFRRFFDSHGHARNHRDEEPQFISSRGRWRMLTAVETTEPFCQAQIWMPNLAPNPITTAARLAEYHAQLLSTQSDLRELHPERDQEYKVRHHIALKLDQNTTAEILKAAAEKMEELGLIKVVKIYPDGVTTNSAGGWSDLSVLYPAIEAAINQGFIICLHGEQPGAMIDTYSRELRFLDGSFADLVRRFPTGKFHLEHITTKYAVNVVKSSPLNIGAGITLQHLLMTRNNFLEWREVEGTHPGCNTHLHCRPPIQTFEDQKALLEVALDAHLPKNQQFCFGSDSAPHLEGTKLCSCGCAGVMSSPVSAAALVGLFDAAGKLREPALSAFTGDNAARYYGVDLDANTHFEVEHRPWKVPGAYGGIVPMYANCVLDWAPTVRHIRHKY